MRTSRSAVVVLLATTTAVGLTPAPVSAGGGDTFVVRSVSVAADVNPGDDVCDGDPGVKIVCTLPAAVEEANLDLDLDRIEFLIGGPTSTVVRTIALESALIVSQPLQIDGYTQPDSAVNTAATGSSARLKIRLTGAGGGIGAAFDVVAPLELRGLVFGAGLDMAASFGPGAAGSVVKGCFIGTSVTGLARDPAAGDVMPSDAIDVYADDVVIGGTARADRNIIVSFELESPSYTVLVDGDADGARIQGNLINVAADGITVLGRSEHAIFLIGVNDNLVGGTASGAGNVIGGALEAPLATVPDPEAALGNRFLRNSIRTPNLPIDLGEDGPTANDGLGDPDDGDNDLQNFPVITSAKTANGVTTIKGNLRSTASRTFRIELFANPGGVRNTRSFLGAKTVTTDGTGLVAWTFTPAEPVAVGKAITATATDIVESQTSEVSALRTVIQP